MERRFHGCLASGLMLPFIASLSHAAEPVANTTEEIVVWGAKKSSREAGYTNPSSLLTPDDFESINVATTEDLVKFEPSVVIRRRYIGDSNGTLGLRGSNMFQTSRSMVFADGVPLHYFLQSRWSGAPRWTMVSASEIAQVEVIYGPFSAEYSGNAMGGVVNIETAIPQQREFHVDTSFFAQQFDAYGFDDTLTGYKTFASYGDKIGDLSYYFSYNRLENESQPQTFYYAGDGNVALANAYGSIIEKDLDGNWQHHYSDTGVEDASTNNYKAKIAYEFGDWIALLNVAYEDRTTLRDSPNAYIYDDSGAPIYSGPVALSNGTSFDVDGSRLGLSELDRNSLNLGLRLRGELNEHTSFEANLSRFDVLKDETRASALNPGDPNYVAEGLITDYDNTGWQTADAKFTFSDVGIQDLDVATGLRYESYQLGIDVYDSSNWASGNKTAINNRSGGETAISAAFVQSNWDINAVWDVTLGVRYERWESRGGFFSENTAASFGLVNVPNRSEDQFSPKFSIGYKPNAEWTFRYSVAKAYRFPIVEELFSQYQAHNSASEANPALPPENGLHHNLMADYALDKGYVRVNIFRENIKDVIESFTDIVTSVTTFHSMGEVETNGVEFIVNQYDWLTSGLDLRFNLAYVDSEIISNPKDPSLVGNTPPRMPKWRGNILLNYAVNDALDISANLQYARDSYGRLDNSDKQHKIYGAQDGYTRLGLKTTYALTPQLELGFGIDNVTDEISYVAHPWPGRTVYGEIRYDL